MAARHHTRPDALGDPCLHDEVADRGLDAHEIAGAHGEPRRVAGMDPERIGVRDLVEPLRVGAACVDLHRQPERGDERHLTGLQIVGMDVALHVQWNRVLRPAPLGKRARVELEPSAGCREAADNAPILDDADGTASVGIRRRAWAAVRC